MEENRTDVRRICQIVTTAAVVVIMILMLIMAFSLRRTLSAVKSYEQRADVLFTQLEDAAEALRGVDLERLADTLNGLTDAMDGEELAETLSSLHDIALQLSEIDIAEMSGQMGETLEAAKEALEAAQTAMDAMDVEAFSKAVEELRIVLEPLAKLANRF